MIRHRIGLSRAAGVLALPDPPKHSPEPAPKRLELLDLLCQGPRSVEALAQQAGISVANASQHLQVLRAARLVEAERKGLYVEYQLADDEVCGFFVALRGLAEARLAEVEQVTREYFERRGATEPIEGQELLRRVKSGEVTVLDVRPAEEFAPVISQARCQSPLTN